MVPHFSRDGHLTDGKFSGVIQACFASLSWLRSTFLSGHLKNHLPHYSGLSGQPVFVFSPTKQPYHYIHQHPAPAGNTKHPHSVQKNPIRLPLRAQRIIVQPVVDDCGFCVTTVRRKQRPQNTRNACKVGDITHRAASGNRQASPAPPVS